MSKQFEQRIKEVIGERPNYSTIEFINGEEIKGKDLRSLYLVVRVARNLFEKALNNMDICYVLGETKDNELVIKRIEDNHIAVVDKKSVQFPEWKPYEF